MKAIIIGSAPETKQDYMKNILGDNQDAFIICADGGYDTAIKNGAEPDLLIGDLDSIKTDNQYIEVIRYPKEKDDQDIKLCVIEAIKRGFDELLIVGASEGRLDHYLANVLLLEFIHDHNAYGELINENNRAVFHPGGIIRILRSPEYDYISIIPLDKALTGVTLQGLKYPLKGATLTRNNIISVCNEFVDESATVEIKKGRALVVFSRDNNRSI